MEHTTIGKRQRMILKCFWNAGGSMTVPEIEEALKRDFDVMLSRSAINTMVQILIEKGFLELEKKKRYAYIYRVTLTKEEYQLQEMEYMKDEIFDGSLKKMLVGFVKERASEEELAEIRELLGRKKDE